MLNRHQVRYLKQLYTIQMDYLRDPRGSNHRVAATTPITGRESLNLAYIFFKDDSWGPAKTSSEIWSCVNFLWAKSITYLLFCFGVTCSVSLKRTVQHYFFVAFGHNSVLFRTKYLADFDVFNSFRSISLHTTRSDYGSLCLSGRNGGHVRVEPVQQAIYSHHAKTLACT